MIVEIQSFGQFFIHVTAQYSNAVLLAMLPYVSDCAKELNLPVRQPITQQQVINCGVTPFIDRETDLPTHCGIRIKGGWTFGFSQGHLDMYESPHSYFTLQDPDEVSKFHGTVRMTKDEAVQMARNTLRKLGIPLEDVYAEQEPRVAPLEIVGTNTIPRYRVEWPSIRSGFHSVEVEVNADAKQVEYIYISPNPNLIPKRLPKINVAPTPKYSKPSSTNPEYVWKLLPIILRAIDDYGRTLTLSIPRPLTTNQVARYVFADNGGWPHCEITLTNGWEFIYRNSMVNGFYSSDDLFSVRSEHRPGRVRDFAGKWNLSEDQAIEVVRSAIAKFNYSTNLLHMGFKPEVHKPAVPGIPRYCFWWFYYPEGPDQPLQSKVEAEVNADNGKLESLYYDNKDYWNHPPPIDVPILVQK